MKRITKVLILTINFLIYFYLSHSQYLSAADISTKEMFKTKHFSIYVDTKKWKFIEQKEQNRAANPSYLKTDLGNALSEPIIGKGSERILYIPDEELNFSNSREKISLSISCWTLPLWQTVGKNKNQLADSIRDAFLLMTHGRMVDINNSNIKYFENTVNDKLFFGTSYTFDGIGSYGFAVHITHIMCCYFSNDLRRRYWFSIDYYDGKRNIEESILINYLNDFLSSFEVLVTDENYDYLDYVICSADSLYMALRQRIIFEEADKTPLSIYKIPISIEQGGTTKRRILKNDFLDIRKHPIQERINRTCTLLTEAVRRYPSEPRVYFGLGLLYEFNMFGERYGEGSKEDLAITAYRNALLADSTFVPARYNLAILYLRKEDKENLDKGINELKKIIIPKKDDNLETYCAIAYAYKKKNDLTSSVSYYKLALSNLTTENKRAAPDLIKHIKEKVQLLSK